MKKKTAIFILTFILLMSQFTGCVTKQNDNKKQKQDNVIDESNYSENTSSFKTNESFKISFSNKEYPDLIKNKNNKNEYTYTYLAKVKKNDKYGFINGEGEVVIPLKYDSVRDFNEGLAVVEKNDKYGFINGEGEVVIPLKYDSVRNFSEGLAVVKKNDKYGFINGEGKVVKPLEYDSVRNFSEGLAVVEKNDKYGFINSEGKVVIPLKYDSVRNFSEGLAVVEKNDKYGFINSEGEVVLPITLEYDSVRNFSEGLARVKKNGKYGFINTKGEIVIPITLEYDSLEDFSEGIAVFFNHYYDESVMTGSYRKYGFINNKGEIVVPLKYSFIDNFSNGLIVASKSPNSDYGLINIEGEVVLPLEYYDISSFSKGLAKVQKNYKYGFINTKGEIVIPVKYNHTSDFREGLARVKKNGKYGYINPENEFVLKIDSNIRPSWFNEGLAKFSINKGLNERMGFINKRGEIVIQPNPKYNFANDFYNGFARVGIYPTKYTDVKEGFINKRGEIVGSIDYDGVQRFEKVKIKKYKYSYPNYINIIEKYIENGISNKKILLKLNDILSPTIEYQIDSNNLATINTDLINNIKTKIKNYKLLKRDLKYKLKEEGIILNKELAINVNVNINGANANLNNKIKTLSFKDLSIANLKGYNNINFNLFGNAIIGFNSREKDKLFSNKLEISYNPKNNDVNIYNNSGGKINVIIPVENENKVVYSGDLNLGGNYNSELNGLEFKLFSSSRIDIKDKISTNFSDLDNKPREMVEAIHDLESKDIIDGANKNEFKPDANLTRAQFSKMVVKTFYELNKDAEENFTDVSKEDWFRDYVASAETSNIIKGYPDKTFKPNGNTTKEQMITILARMLVEKNNYSYPTNTRETNQLVKPVSEWAQKEVELALQENIIKLGELKEPQKPITRGESSIFLKRLYDKIY